MDVPTASEYYCSISCDLY